MTRSTSWTTHLLRAALGVAAVGALSLSAATPTAYANARGAAALMPHSDEVRELTVDVASLSLYHELNLSAEQRQQLSAILRPFHEALAPHKKALQSQQSDMESALRAARSELQKNGAISEATSKRLSALQDTGRASQKQANALVGPTRDAVLAVLTPAQRAMVQDYRVRDAFEDEDVETDPALRKVDAMREMTPDQIDARATNIEQRAINNGRDGSAKAAAFRTLVAEMQAVPDSDWPNARVTYAEQMPGSRGGGSNAKGQHGSKGHSGAKSAGKDGGRTSAQLLLTEAFYDAVSAKGR